MDWTLVRRVLPSLDSRNFRSAVPWLGGSCDVRLAARRVRSHPIRQRCTNSRGQHSPQADSKMGNADASIVFAENWRQEVRRRSQVAEVQGYGSRLLPQSQILVDSYCTVFVEYLPFVHCSYCLSARPRLPCEDYPYSSPPFTSKRRCESENAVRLEWGNADDSGEAGDSTGRGRTDDGRYRADGGGGRRFKQIPKLRNPTNFLDLSGVFLISHIPRRISPDSLETQCPC